MLNSKRYLRHKKMLALAIILLVFESRDKVEAQFTAATTLSSPGTSAQFTDTETTTVSSPGTSAQLIDTTTTSAQLIDTTTTSAQLIDTTTTSAQLIDTTTTSAQFTDTAATTVSSPGTSAQFTDTTTTSAQLTDATTTSAQLTDTETTTVSSPGTSAQYTDTADALQSNGTATNAASSAGPSVQSTVSAIQDKPITKSTVPPATSAKSLKPTVPPPRSLPAAETNITVNFTVKYTNDNFTEDLLNKSSEAYIHKEREYNVKLTKIYENVTGFQNVTITGFRNGSVIVDYDVFFKNVNLSKLYDTLNDEIHLALKNDSGIDKSYLDENFPASVKKVAAEAHDTCNHDNACGDDSRCEIGDNLFPVCQHNCHDHQCDNGGYCVLNTEHTAECRCPSADGFVFGGERCGIKAEKLDLGKNYIIGIAAGGGGGVILILIAIIMVVCKRKQRPRSHTKIRDDGSEQSFKSIRDSEDGLHHSYLAHTNSVELHRNPAYRPSEERAENMANNPYGHVQRSQKPDADRRDLSSGFEDPHKGRDGFERVKMSRQGRTTSQKTTDEIRQQTPQHFDPAHHTRASIRESAYSEIDDAGSTAYVYQPLKSLRPLSEYHPSNLREHPPTDYNPANQRELPSTAYSPANQRELSPTDYNPANQRELSPRDYNPANQRELPPTAYRPTNQRELSSEPTLYDYYNQVSKTPSRPVSDDSQYDEGNMAGRQYERMSERSKTPSRPVSDDSQYDEGNMAGRQYERMSERYAIKRPLVSSQKRF